MTMKKKDEDSVFSLRLSAKDAERLAREARSRGTTISTMARQAISTGLMSMTSAPLSYGIPDQQPGVTLTIATLGITMPESSTTGGLAADIKNQ